MAIVNFNFTKLSVQKKENPRGKVNVRHNIGIKKVEEQDLSLPNSESSTGLRIEFLFSLAYEPEIGSMEFEGNLSMIVLKANVPEIMDSMKKIGIPPKSLLQKVMPVVFNKSLMHAILLAKEVNLPSPLPLPKLKIEDIKSNPKLSK